MAQGSGKEKGGRDISAVELRHKRQVESLTHTLRTTETERDVLQAEVNTLKQEKLQNVDEKGRLHERLKQEREISAKRISDGQILEVVSTDDLRERLFLAESELDEARRRLDVDARMALEREQHRSAALSREVQNLQAKVSELEFDLKRARGVKGDEWSQQEEEQMRLNLRLRRMEEDAVNFKTLEKDMADKLLFEEHRNMELLFDKSQTDTKIARLQNRVLELEVLYGKEKETRQQAESGGEQQGRSGGGTGGATVSRKEKNLEAVVEGLERVILTLRRDNQRLQTEVETSRSDKGGPRAEVKMLRRRVDELQAELAHKDVRQKEAGKEIRRISLGQHKAASETETALRRELEAKTAMVQELEGRLQAVADAAGEEMQAADGRQRGTPATASAAVTTEASELRRELADLRVQRQKDWSALEEANRALAQTEVLERRCSEVERENRKLKDDLNALEDDGFWQDLDNLKIREKRGRGLLQQMYGAFEDIVREFPALEVPTALLADVEHFVASAAA